MQVCGWHNFAPVIANVGFSLMRGLDNREAVLATLSEIAAYLKTGLQPVGTFHSLGQRPLSRCAPLRMVLDRGS